MPDTREKAILLYAGACPKCRFLSRMIIILALGSMTRVTLDRAEAEQFYRVDHLEARGKPALVEGETMTFGWRVMIAVPRLILKTWWSLLRSPFRSKTVIDV